MTYDPNNISSFFDSYGTREWDRLVATPVDEISLHIHTHYLQRFVSSGDRVLEIGAGAGRFTQILAQMGSRVLAADISPVQLDLNRHFAESLGFAQAVEDWQQVDITDLSRFPDESFHQVVAYGGPFSYVLDRRDQALRECVRVLKPGGCLLASVMALWGSARRDLLGTLQVPVESNLKITSTGDLTEENFPARKRQFMHLFRAEEVRRWLSSAGLRIAALSASGVLAVAWDDRLGAVRENPAQWNELLRMELEASADPGGVGMGTHIIFVAQK